MASFSNWIKDKAKEAADAAGDVASTVQGAVQNPAGAIANAATNLPVVGQYAQPVANVLNNPIVSALTNPVGTAVNTIGGGITNNVIVPYAAPTAQNLPTFANPYSWKNLPNAISAENQAVRGGIGLGTEAVTATPGYIQNWVPKMGMATQQFVKHPSLGTFYQFAATAADPYLRIANTPVERVHEYQGAGAYYLAVNGGKMRGSDQAMPFNFAVQWAKDNPNEWNNIIRVHDQGYDSDGDGTIDYRGDRAVWEYYIGKQSNWVKVAAEVVNDPWNLTLVLGGVEALAGKGSMAAGMEGNLATQQAFQRVAKAAGWTDTAINRVLDAPFRAVGKAVRPLGRAPGLRWLLEESPTSTVQRTAAEAEQVIGTTPRVSELMPLPDWAAPTTGTGQFDVIALPDNRAYVIDPEGNPIPGYSFDGRGAETRAREAQQSFLAREAEGDTVPTGTATTPFPEQAAVPPPAEGTTPFVFQQTRAQRAESLANDDLSTFAPRLGDQRIVTIAQQAAVDHPEASRGFFATLGIDPNTGRAIPGSPLFDTEAQHRRLEEAFFDAKEGGLARKAIEQKLVYGDATIRRVVPAYREAFGDAPALALNERSQINDAASTFIAMTKNEDEAVRASGFSGLTDLALYDPGPEGDKAIRALNGMGKRGATWLRQESPVSGDQLLAEINRLRGRMKRGGAFRPEYTPVQEITPPPGTPSIPPAKTTTAAITPNPVETWLGTGQIDEATADFLNSSLPGLDAPLIDVMADLERRGLSERQVRNTIASRVRASIQQVPRAQRKGLIGKVDSLTRFVRRESKANRQRMQYAMLNGVSGGANDLMGNSVHFWQAGDLEGAYRNFRNVQYALQGEEAVGDYFTRQHNDFLKGIDLDFVAPDTAKFGSGDTELVDLQRLAEREIDNPVITGIVKTAGGNPWVMDRRHGLDAVSRNTTREQVMRDLYPEKLLDFTQYADGKGYDLTELMPRLKQAAEDRGVQGPWFSVEDIRKLTGDDTLAKRWRAAIADMKRKADAEVKTRFFENATRTRLDDAISKVVYFHFWQSRAIALQMRNMVRQPRVLGGYYRLMQGMQNQAEQNNYPDWAKALTGYYSGPGGFHALTGAVQFLVPAAMFLDLGNAREDATTVQQIMSVLPVNPFLNAAAAVMGQSDNVPNLLGTSRAQNLMRTVANYLTSIGLGDQLPVEDPVQWGTRAALKAVNERADAVPGIDAWEPYDPKSGNLDTISSVIYEIGRERFGDDTTAWTPDQWAEINDAITSLEAGDRTNDITNEAYDRWATASIVNVAPQMLTPGSSVLRYGPRDEAIAENADRAAAKDAGLQPTPEQEAAHTERGYVTASPAARNLQTEEFKVEALGTARQKAFYQGYNAIRYPDENADPNDYVDVMGVRVTVGMLNSLSPDERKTIADEWVREQGGTEELDQFFSLRSSAKAQSAILTTREQYRDLVDGFASPSAFRDWAAGEYPFFKRAMDDYAGYLRDTRGLSGDLLENELDAWVNFDSAFLAFTGQNDSRYDTAAPGDGYDFGPPTVGSGSATSGGGGLADRIQVDQQQYFRTLDDLKAQGVSDYMINWMRQYAGSSGLLPEASDETKAYWAWRDRQPSGSDISVQSYIKWLNGVSPATNQTPAAFR